VIFLQTVEEDNSLALPWRDQRVLSNYRKRRAVDITVKVLTVAAVLLVLYPLMDMLFMFAYKGLLVISIARLSESTTGLGGGGLWNAIVGSIILIALSAGISVPIGVFAGVYLSEFASPHNRFANLIRFMADVLAGVPSIVLGYVGYLLFVIYFGWGFSALAGGLTLSILMFPYILRTTEISIRKVPDSIREGAMALGSTKTTMINRLTLRFAMPGIITGILLAISISLSETAPLLYTAQFNNFIPTQVVHAPIGYLTYIVWTFSQIPTTSAQDLAYLASFILITFVISINLAARIGLRRFSKI